MEITKTTCLVFALFGLLIAVNAFGDDSSTRAGGRRQGPPPEAFTACEGKNAGDEAQFTSPRGDTVTGVCVEMGDKLVLRPDQPRGNPGGAPGNNN